MGLSFFGTMTSDLLNEDACREFVLSAARGTHPTCPGCGKEFPDALRRRLFSGAQIQCDSCDRWSSPRTGTVLENSDLTYSQIVLIFSMLHWGLPVSVIAEAVSCTGATVRNWRRRIVEAD